MTKRVEMGGKVHEFPDDFTDADISSALASEPYSPPEGSPAARLFNNPKAVEEDTQKARQASAQEEGPLSRAAAGAGRFAYGLVPGKKARDVRESFDQATDGDAATAVGKLAPEILATAAGGEAVAGAARLGRVANPILRAMASGAANAAPSAALHQAQNVNDGGQASLGGAAAEIGGSAALGGAGNAAGGYLRKKAPEILRSAVKPILSAMGSSNPPKFSKALENNLVPYFGGAEASAKKSGALVSALGASRDALATGKVAPVHNALLMAQKELAQMANNPKQQLLTGQAKDASDALDFWANEAAQRSTAGPTGKMNVADALGFRQKIDDAVSWRKKNNELTPGFETASKIVRRKIEEEIGKSAPGVRQKTRELAGIVPIAEALKRRSLQEGNNYKVGLLDLAAMGAAGGMGAAAAGPAAGGSGLALGMGAVAGRRLLSTPGGAAMLYDAGRSLGRKSTLRNLGIQGARTIGNDQAND